MLCVSLFANIMLLWEIICLCDDLDAYKAENERLVMNIDKLLYGEKKNVGINEEA